MNSFVRRNRQRSACEAAISLLAFAGFSCDIGLPGGGNAPLLDGLQKQMLTASVKLADGVNLPAGAVLNSAFGSAAIDEAGQAAVEIIEGGPQLVSVATEDGVPVALAWLYPDRLEIDSHTTAEVLVSLRLGILHAQAGLREKFLKAIIKNKSLNPLAAAIEAAQSDDIAALVAEHPAWLDELDAIVASLEEPLDAGLDLDNAKTRASIAALVIKNSASRSGVTMLQEPPEGAVQNAGLNKLWIENAYRRRVLAVIRKESFVDGDGNTVPAVETVAETELSSISAVTGVASALQSIVNGIAFGNLPYQPVYSDAIDTPVSPDDARQTNYKAYVLGAGLTPGDALPSDDPSFNERLYEIQAKTFVLDLIAPTVINVVLPAYSDRLDSFYNRTQATDLVLDILNICTQYAPGALEKVRAGNLRGAWDDFWFQFTGSNLMRDAILLAMANAINLVDGVASIDAVNQLNGVVSNVVAIDRVVSAGDAILQILQILSSEQVVAFDIAATKSRVRLDPASQTIIPFDRAKLMAHVPDAGGDNAPVLAYEWSYSGEHGILYDNETGQFISTSGDQRTNSNAVELQGGVEGTQSITVKVYNITAEPDELIGEASADVVVKESKLQMRPRKISVTPGGSARFAVTVPDNLEGRVDGTALSYHWRCTGRVGKLGNGALAQVTDVDNARFLAKSGVTGEDTISVEVFQKVNGKSESLGTAQGRAIVESKKHVIVAYNAFVTNSHYSYDPATNFYESGVGVSFRFPKVNKAVSYDIYFYGFFDGATNTSSRFHSWTNPPTVPNGWEDKGDTVEIGWSGSVGFGPGDPGASSLEEGEAWYASRLAGCIVELTVKYEGEE